MQWLPSQDFVGRTAEQRMLADLLDRVARKDGGTVLVTGEAGIGKSRIAEETAVNATSAGFTVAWGRCRESAGAPPLWPWTQVLRQTRSRPIEPEGAADAAGRFRYFERITRRIAELSSAAPLLIILDDIHCADEASVRLLGFVTDQLWPSRTGFLITYRETELTHGSGARIIADVATQRRSRTMLLQGLGSEDVRDWLQRENLHLDDHAGARLHQRTGGNPLFLTEMVRLARVGQDSRVPSSIRELINSRISMLPGATRTALEMAAVLGREFGYAPLAAALQTSPLAVLEALEPAVRAAVIATDPLRQGGYRFVHMLVREAVVDSVNEVRRAELHTTALPSLRGTGWGGPSDLAHHAIRARAVIGDTAAADFTIAAAEAADRALAWEDAAGWWQATAELRPTGPGVLDRQTIRLRLGQALLHSGQVAAARECFEQLAAHALEVEDSITLAEAALAVGDTIAEVKADPGLIHLLDQALAQSGLPDAVRVQLESRRAMAAYWSPVERSDARLRSEAALDQARDLGDDRALGAALVARQYTLRGPDDLAERIGVGEEACEIGERLDDDELRFRGHQWLIPDRFQAGDLPGVQTELAAAASIAAARRDPFQRWWVVIFTGLLAGFHGDDGEAEHCAREVGTLGRRLGQPAADVYEMGQLVPLFWRAGRLPELEAGLTKVVKEFPGLPTLECDLTLLLAVTGRRTAAGRHLRYLVANNFAAFRRDSLFLASLAILAASAAILRDEEQAAVILPALAPYAGRNLIQGAPTGWGCAAWYLAALAALLGDQNSALEYQATAHRLHQQWRAGPIGPISPGSTLAPGALIAPTVPTVPTSLMTTSGLSDRERTVLGLLSAGHSNKEIATALNISVHTAERHVANIFVKLRTRNRAEATVWALRHGISHPAT